jgi:16S rRNA processing protein RimM
MANYINIGKLVATFGVKGEMILKHSLGKKTALKGLACFFLENPPGSFLPYFPLEMKAKSETEVQLIIEGIDSKEIATSFLQQQVWLTDVDFKKHVAATAPISFIGFVVYDGKKPLGEVLEVIEQPHQVLCRIQYLDNDDILIPLNEQSISSIDVKSRKLLLNLPDGLIEAQL